MNGANLALVPPAQKQAILGSLDTVEALMREYAAQFSTGERLETTLRFSCFLVWARKRMKEIDDEQTNSEA